MSTLVELFAGTASVSLWCLGGPSRPFAPLVGYLGSKRRLASLLGRVLGFEARPPDRVLLVDAGPWGDAWTVLRDRHMRAQVAELLANNWATWDVAELWQHLVQAAPSDTDHPHRVAQFLWLQARAAGCIPVWWSAEHGRWRSPTGAVDPERSMDLANRTRGLPDRVGRPSSKGIAPSVAGRRGWGSGRQTAALIGSRVRMLDALPWDRVEVRYGRAEDVVAADYMAATVYLDPPYQGCPRYAATIPREDVVGLARYWASAGCRVLLSEAEGLAVDSELSESSWNHLRLDTAKPEWLTANYQLAPLVPHQPSLFARSA